MNQWWVKEFCKGNESLEDEEHRGWPQEVDKDQLRDIIKDDPLTTAEVDEELNVDHSMVFWHLKQIGKVKKFDKWVPHELTKIKKKKTVILKYCLLLFQAIAVNHFLIRL